MKLQTIAQSGQLLILAVIALASVSCHQATFIAVSPPSTVSRQQLDQAVLEAMMLDLVTSADEESRDLRQEQNAGHVLFSVKCVDRVGWQDQELGAADSEKWRRFSKIDRAKVSQASSDVIRRIQAKDLFGAFKPVDRRISLWEDDPASTQPVKPYSFDPTRSIEICPPGYCENHSLAVVVIGFSWSMHGGSAAYVLRFDGQKWIVVSRHFAYYV